MKEIVLLGKYALYLDGYQRLIMLYYNHYNVLLLSLHVVVLTLRTYRVVGQHEWCEGSARVVRSVKDLVICWRERFNQLLEASYTATSIVSLFYQEAGEVVNLRNRWSQRRFVTIYRHFFTRIITSLLFANTKERMYLCCGNSGATFVRHLIQIGHQILNIFCFIIEQIGCLQGAGVTGYVKL